MYDMLGYLGTRWETLDTLGFDRIQKDTLGYAMLAYAGMLWDTPGYDRIY